MIALVLVTVGLLTLAWSGVFVKDMLDRSTRAADAVAFATRRLELLRPRACTPSARSDGSESLQRGSARLATNVWSFEARGRATLIRVITTYATGRGHAHADTVQSTVPCVH